MSKQMIISWEQTEKSITLFSDLFESAENRLSKICGIANERVSLPDKR